jgi:hypothetical protein
VAPSGTQLVSLLSPVLLAAAGRAARRVESSGLPYYVGAGLLALAIVIGVPIAHRIWRETHEPDDAPSNEDMLEEFRQAYEAGEMDEAEFRRVSELLRGPQGGNPGDVATARPVRTPGPPLPSGGTESPTPPPTDPAPPPSV